MIHTDPPRVPTQEQEDVIGSTASRLVVSASAGSGKTYVLVERYLRHVLEEGMSPNNILAITFTRKAAAEMKSRIVTSLRTAGRSADAQAAETGPIQTVDSFCERMLRENAPVAGIDPDFEILDESAANQLLRESIYQAISDSAEDSPLAERLITALAGKGKGGGDQHTNLIEMAEHALKSLRGSGVSLEEIENKYSSPSTALFNWHMQVRQSLSGPPAETLQLDTLDDGFLARLRAAFGGGRNVPNWSRGSEEGAQRAAEQACGLMVIVGNGWRRFESSLAKHQRFDFPWLELKSLSLLKENELVSTRLRSQYRVLLVDEAQDHTRLQNELFRELGIESEMKVGDPQQSIYGFRFAHPEFFEHDQGSSTTKNLTLNKRSEQGILAFIDRVFGEQWPEKYIPMRSIAVSGPFSIEEPTDYTGMELWASKNEDAEAVARWVAETISELRSTGHTPRDMAILVRRASYAHRLIPALERQGIQGQIIGGSERFYARMEIRDVANALVALASPNSNYALLALLRSPFVGLSMDSIVVLAQAGSVRNVIEGFAPDTETDRPKLDAFLEWFSDLSEYADRLPAWEVIAELYARTSFLETLARRRDGKQRVANARKLLSLATNQPTLGPVEYAETIRAIQSLRHREGDAPALDDEEQIVKIMTIHKSKGLEFPTVVATELYGKMGGNHRGVLVEPDIDMVVPLLPGESASWVFNWMLDRNKARETAEEWRVLYVAMTRARNRLCLAVDPSGKRGTLAGALGARLLKRGGDLPGAKIRSVESK